MFYTKMSQKHQTEMTNEGPLSSADESPTAPVTDQLEVSFLTSMSSLNLSSGASMMFLREKVSDSTGKP